MNRRRAFAILTLGGAGVLAGGMRWLALPKHNPELAVETAQAQLAGLDLSRLQATGEWELARTFEHLAQSIEFSLSGFPESKSPLFQNTVGRLAYNVFQTRGAMRHGLNEPIPGEDVATASVPLDEAITRLRTALRTFQAHDGALALHFAYGALSKPEYAMAHVMHINNHFEEIQIA